MNFNSKRTVTDEQNERHKRILAQTLKEEGNKSCADCKTRNPTWASVNLGVFVCLTCSGIHRSLGVHISQVRSCNLDTWLPKQVEFCRAMGNVRGNRYWESRLPKDFRRPPSGNPNPELAAFIRAKYVDRAFAVADVPPPNIDNYLEHPLTKLDASGAGSEQSAGPAPSAMAPVATVRSTPVKPASSPALTTDLLGGFDEIASGSRTPVVAETSAAAPAASSSNDPFGFGNFVAAPPAPASGSHVRQARTSNEWTDFHVAPSTSNHAANAKEGHHRSYSAGFGEGGLAHTPSAAAQPSLLGPSHTHPAKPHHHHHHHHGSHPSSSHHQGSHQLSQPVSATAAAAVLDPFAALASPASPEDLLAGLTIHHVMDTMGAGGTSSNGGAALQGTTSGVVGAGHDPFFTSSATNGPMPAPGAGHRRRPSHAKEEVLRLFDAPGGGSTAPAASSDPFGDFLGAPAPANGGHQKSGSMGNGVDLL